MRKGKSEKGKELDRDRVRGQKSERGKYCTMQPENRMMRSIMGYSLRIELWEDLKSTGGE